jgi:hypothetical protein
VRVTVEMMKRSVETGWNQEIWRGSVDDLADLLSRGRALVSTAIGEDDPETRAVIRRDGDDLEFDDWLEFQKFVRNGDRRLQEGRRIVVRVGRHEALHVTLTFHRSLLLPALSCSVSGADAVAVSGVAAEIKREARHNGWPVPFWRTLVFIWVVGFALTLPYWLNKSAVAEWLTWAGVAIELGTLATAWILPLLVPRLEIDDPSGFETPRRGARRALLRSMKWLLAVVAGGLIYALLEKLVNG